LLESPRIFLLPMFVTFVESIDERGLDQDLVRTISGSKEF